MEKSELKVDAFINSSSSFLEFFEKARLLQPKEQGDVFERVVQLHLKSKPKYASELDEVWQLQEVPLAVCKYLNLPKTDEGIDLIAKHMDGTYWAIQAKYRSNPDHRLSWGSKGGLSTFTSLSFTTCKNIAFGLVCATTNKPLKKTYLTKGVGFELFGDFLDLEDNDGEGWKQLKKGLEGEPTPPKTIEPLPHQHRAIQNAEEYFIEEGNPRGKLIMPCGTGKSLTGFWIAVALNAKEIIVAVPSLALIKQTLNVWTREYLAHGIRPKWLSVCSDESAGTVDSDSFTAQVYDIGVPCVTDPALIKKFLKAPTEKPRIVFTTYQSGPVLAMVAKSLKHCFDLGIMDEAHKTVGRKDKVFAHLIDNKNIGIDKRVFMTATERFYRGSSDKIASMHDPRLYGETFELLTFKRAIEADNIICDYRFVTIGIAHSEIKKLWEDNAYLRIERTELNEDTTRSLASGLALRKAYAEFDIKRAISFHRSIKLAKNFAEQQEKMAMAFPELTEVDCFHVSSQLSTGDRADQLRDFGAAKRGLITNARCLTEGVDIPSVDCVLFADPRRSKVDIVQAAGRALRKSPGKTFGYIIVPLVVPDDVDLEEFAEGTNFAQVVTTIKALAAEDERIIEDLRVISTGSTPTGGKIEVNLTEILSRKLDAALLHDNLQLEVWEKIARLNWRLFDEARVFVRSLKLMNEPEWRNFTKLGKLPADIPVAPDQVYREAGWVSWGDWLGTGSIATYKRKYRPFDDAKSFVKSLKLMSRAEWSAFTKSEKLPLDIPADPSNVYRDEGWNGWGDWLDTGTISPQNREYRTFEEARAFAQSLNLKNQAEWTIFTKSGKLPIDIPAAPGQVYREKGWAGFGDWLGTGKVATHLRKYCFFEEARTLAQSLQLKSQAEWKAFVKSGKLPENIPTKPDHVYKEDGWAGYGDWLGTGAIASQKKVYRTFQEARTFAQGLKLKSQTEWIAFAKSGKLPSDIPASPSKTYKEKGWAGFGDWLGTGTVATFKRKYRSFIDARTFVRRLELKSHFEWLDFTKSGRLPDDIPAGPERTYKNKGWAGMGDWLGTGTIASQNRRYRTFEDARTFARSLKLRSGTEWTTFTRSGKLPDDIPATPHHVYKQKGWAGMGDWLGTGTIATQKRVYRPFDEARVFVRSLKLKNEAEWRNFTKSGKLPADIPANPYKTYKDQGWAGLRDWLGTRPIG